MNHQKKSQYKSTFSETSLFAPQGSNLIVASWEAPGTPAGSVPDQIAPLHIHHEDDEAWYIVEGSLGFQVDEEQFEAHTGEVVIVPRGKAHTFWNPSTSETRYLIMMTKQIDALIQEIHSTSGLDYSAMKKIFEKHASTLLG